MEKGTGPTHTIWISFPQAPYTHECALKAAHRVLQREHWHIIDGSNDNQPPPIHADVYFADYDLLPFEEHHPGSSSQSSKFPQLSSYVIRKSLIRKNYLAHSLHVAKVKASTAKQIQEINRVLLAPNCQEIAPKTWTFEATCADDLDELLSDDLYDVREELDANQSRSNQTWFILKPALADQGMGIRLFESVEALQRIFEEFEPESDEDEEDEVQNIASSTAVITSQVRQFVIQEYVADPLLVKAPTLQDLHKFHIRAYILAQGNLKIYLYDDMLALFASTPYQPPQSGITDLASHLTNTSRQDDTSGINTVHLLSDLEGCQYGSAEGQVITGQMLDRVRKSVAASVAEAFVASTKAGRVHFQPWPNAWEMYGVDLMLSMPQSSSNESSRSEPSSFRTWLLEINAQPDFAKSGPVLQEKITNFFVRTLQITSLEDEENTKSWPAGMSKEGMTLCLDLSMSAGGW